MKYDFQVDITVRSEQPSLIHADLTDDRDRPMSSVEGIYRQYDAMSRECAKVLMGRAQPGQIIAQVNMMGFARMLDVRSQVTGLAPFILRARRTARRRVSRASILDRDCRPHAIAVSAVPGQDQLNALAPHCSPQWEQLSQLWDSAGPQLMPLRS